MNLFDARGLLRMRRVRLASLASREQGGWHARAPARSEPLSAKRAPDSPAESRKSRKIVKSRIFCPPFSQTQNLEKSRKIAKSRFFCPRSLFCLLPSFLPPPPPLRGSPRRSGAAERRSEPRGPAERWGRRLRLRKTRAGGARKSAGGAGPEGPRGALL